MQNLKWGPVPPEVRLALEQVEWFELSIWILDSVLSLEHCPTTRSNLGLTLWQCLVQVTMEVCNQVGVCGGSVWFEICCRETTQGRIGSGLHTWEGFRFGKVQDGEPCWPGWCRQVLL